MLEKAKYTNINSLEEISDDFFRDNQTIQRLIFDGLHFKANKFENSLIQNCKFRKCFFEGCIFDEMDFQRVRLDECTLKNCTLSKGFRFITGTLKKVQLDDVDFRGAHIQNVKWLNCTLDSVDFTQIKGKSMMFSGGRFGRVIFDDAHIVRGDFRSIPNLKRSLFYTARLEECAFEWNEAFIIMEFGNSRMDDLYKYGIKTIVEEAGFEPKRVDQYEFHGQITDQILQNILTCQIVIAECSAANKNVFFEIGYALGNKREVIFLVDNAANIPFDLKDFRFIIHHDSIDELRGQLKSRLDYFVKLRESAT
jgi:uncharacterized protein YjbI with pentapeptide repeats